MLPISGLLWGWSRIMHVKLSCLNSWSCCCYIVTLRFHYLRNWPTIKRNKIACQSAGKQVGDDKEPRNTISYIFSESYFSQVQWRNGNGASVKSILMWKFSVVKGCSCLSRDTHPFWEGLPLYSRRWGFKGSGEITSAEDTGPELPHSQDIAVWDERPKTSLSLAESRRHVLES